MRFDRYITDFFDGFVNAKEKWNYEDGCVLTGLEQLYRITKNPYYKDFIIQYMEQFITDDGHIKTYDMESYNIDSIHTGKVLFFLYEETKEEKYKAAIERLMEQLKSHPRTKSGNFWHKKIYPNQIWLDGLYMAQPFYMMYDVKFGNVKHFVDITSQFQNVRKYLYDENKHLYYHGYDESREQPWSDKETGLSKNFWLRAMGWFLMALVDTMDAMPKELEEQHSILGDIFKEAVSGLLQYQDSDTALFYQLIDKCSTTGNYLETSGSAMIAYALLKGAALSVLPKEEFWKKGEAIILSLYESKLVEQDGRLVLKDICSVAGLGPGDVRDGSIEYYLSEPIVSDDHKGTGAFLMAFAQFLNMKLERGEDISRYTLIHEKLEAIS